jgi:hypothetical protein
MTATRDTRLAQPLPQAGQGFRKPHQDGARHDGFQGCFGVGIELVPFILWPLGVHRCRSLLFRGLQLFFKLGHTSLGGLKVRELWEGATAKLAFQTRQVCLRFGAFGLGVGQKLWDAFDQRLKAAHQADRIGLGGESKIIAARIGKAPLNERCREVGQFSCSDSCCCRCARDSRSHRCSCSYPGSRLPIEPRHNRLAELRQGASIAFHISPNLFAYQQRSMICISAEILMVAKLEKVSETA